MNDQGTWWREYRQSTHDETTGGRVAYFAETVVECETGCGWYESGAYGAELDRVEAAKARPACPSCFHPFDDDEIAAAVAELEAVRPDSSLAAVVREARL